MSIGGPQAQPAFMNAVVNPATPEKISQKHIVVSRRIDEINDVQDFGHAGRSLENFKELNEPRRVSSTRRISSGLDSAVVTSSPPESSLSDWVVHVGAFNSKSTIGRCTELNAESTKPKCGSHAPGSGKTRSRTLTRICTWQPKPLSQSQRRDIPRRGRRKNSRSILAESHSE